jgi:ketosteroid isomerase-like protein
VDDTAVDFVRAYFDAWNRRDLEALEVVLDPEVEWERSADFPEGRTLHGRESLVDFARSMFDVFAETPLLGSQRRGIAREAVPEPRGGRRRRQESAGSVGPRQGGSS